MTQTLPIGTTIVNKLTGVELTIVRDGNYARIMQDYIVDSEWVRLSYNVSVTKAELAALFEVYDPDLSEIDDYLLTNGQRLFPLPTYKIGQRFTNGVTEYILADTQNGVTLINLNTGEYHRSPVVVDDLYKITEDEFNQMHYNCMKLIGK